MRRPLIAQVAADFEKAEGEDRANEKKLVDEFRAASRSHQALGTPAPDSPLPQLKQIQQQRDDRAMQARSQLKALLGDDAFESLEIFIHGSMGRAKHIILPVPLGAKNGGPQ